ITSRHTSYIAVDENLTELYFGSIQRRQIPSQLSTAHVPSYPRRGSGRFASSCTDNDERVRSSELRSVLSKFRQCASIPHDQHRSATSSRATGSISGQSRYANNLLAKASKEGYNIALFTTALAISYLTTDLKEQKDSWNLVAKKAEKWMAQTCTDTKILQLIMASAEESYKKYGTIKN
ncbi:hypothetical protein Fcan01_27371, partial [Folsomia candida]